jgi:carbonic anhydrase
MPVPVGESAVSALQDTTISSVNRRVLLGLMATSFAGIAIARGAGAAEHGAPPKPQNVLSPDAALNRLMTGNARYVAGTGTLRDFRHERAALTQGQNPFAAVLGCADSRISPEYCFDTSLGDIFVCRVAGNFASRDVLASLEYAVAVLKTPLVMVLGHESCGAVEAAVKSVTKGEAPPGHLPGLVAALAPAVVDVQKNPGDLLSNAIHQNVRRNVEALKSSMPILKSAVDGGQLRVVGGVYQLATGRVELLV